MLLKQENTLVGKGLIVNVKKTEAEGYKQKNNIDEVKPKSIGSEQSES